MFYLHDYADYVGRHSHIAQIFSELGYDFHGMDMRGHGKSEGLTGFVEHFGMLSTDFKVYMTQVVEELYSTAAGFDTVPPVFLVAHGLGASVTMKFLLSNDHDNDLISKIKAIGLFNPFFQWSKPTEMEAAASFFRMNYNLLKLQNAGNEFNFARTFE